MNYIEYKGNCYRRLTIGFSPRLNGADFFKILELVDFPMTDAENVLLKYALTELVTNSVRALNEKKSEREVMVELTVAGNYLKIIVTDYAGGFDLKELPMMIGDESKPVDITAREFQEYRERHRFHRFGIGLVSAKMALDAFRLVFIDENGAEREWRGAGSVAGTRITAAKRIAPADADRTTPEAGAAIVSRSRRHSIFTKVKVNNALDGYLVDISADGLKLLLIDRDNLEQGEIISVAVAADGFPGALELCAVIRWISQEKAFWQIGSEFIRDAAFPHDHIRRLVRTVEIDPRRMGGLVVIEGT